MLICGIDPGLRDCGWALVDTVDSHLVGAGHIATERRDDVGDTQRRLCELTEQLAPHIRRSCLVVVEWSSVSGGGFKREGAEHGSARAALFNAAAAAAAIGMAQAHRIHLLTPAPVSWRAALGYARDEAAIHAVITRAYPRTVAKLRATARPHVLDAIGLALHGRAHATNLFHRHNRNRTKGPTTP